MSDDAPRPPAASDELRASPKPQVSAVHPEEPDSNPESVAPQASPEAAADAEVSQAPPPAKPKRRVRLVRRAKKKRRVRLVRRPLKRPIAEERSPVKEVEAVQEGSLPEEGVVVEGEPVPTGREQSGRGLGAVDASGATRGAVEAAAGASLGEGEVAVSGGRLVGVRDGALGLVKAVADVGLTALETGEALLPEALKPSLGAPAPAQEEDSGESVTAGDALSPEKSARVTSLVGASEGLVSLGWAGWNRVLGAAGGVLFEDNFEGELDPDNPAEGLQRMASAMVTGVTVSLLQRAGVAGGERLTEEAVRRLSEELPVMRLLSGVLGKPEEAARVEAVVHDAREIAEEAPSRRAELARRVGGEVRRFLEDNLTRELQRVLSHLSFEVRTEITFDPVEVPSATPGEAPRRRLKPSIKNHLRVKRRGD